MKTGKQGNLRGEPEKRRGGRRKLEEDGKERIDKERQPLFAITDRCGLPGLDVRTEDTGLRSDQSFRCASCGTARLIGFGVDSPSKSRATTTSKERERTDRQRTSPLFFLRTEGTGLRSGQLFRCASCGTAQLAGFGVVSPSKSRVTTSISIELSIVIASSARSSGSSTTSSRPIRKKLR